VVSSVRPVQRKVNETLLCRNFVLNVTRLDERRRCYMSRSNNERGYLSLFGGSSLLLRYRYKLEKSASTASKNEEARTSGSGEWKKVMHRVLMQPVNAHQVANLRQSFPRLSAIALSRQSLLFSSCFARLIYNTGRYIKSKQVGDNLRPGLPSSAFQQ